MKVCVQYCHGLCGPVSSATRLAMYLVAENTLCADRADLGCGPALEAGVPEDVEFIERDPVVAVEACAEACARRLLERHGADIARQLFAEDILAEAGLDPAALDHTSLHLDHPAVIALAEAITAAARSALAGEPTPCVSEDAPDWPTTECQGACEDAPAG
jgi:uncharacterized metal-binding protein